MSFTKGDLGILESILCEEDFSLCHELFKKESLLEFLEAEDLDLAYGRTQSRLKHLITVVKPWSCVKVRTSSFMLTTGIELSDPGPCTLVWNGFCTIGCPLCNALKNYALRNDLRLDRRWKHRPYFFHLHRKLISMIIQFLEDNIVHMVNKHFQNKPTAPEEPSCVHIEPTVEEAPAAVIEKPVTHDRTSPKRVAEPFRSIFMFMNGTDDPPTEDEMNSLLGLTGETDLPESDHDIENDEPRPSFLN
jgi:hypothetical protein